MDHAETLQGPSRAAVVALFFGFSALCPAPAEADESQVSKIHEALVFAEDFETVEEVVDLPGQPLEGEREAGVFFSSQAGKVTLGSRHLIVSAGRLVWESEKIPIGDPLLTHASIDLTLIAGPAGFHHDDLVKVSVRTEHDQVVPRSLVSRRPVGEDFSRRPVLRFEEHLPHGALAERSWSDNSFFSGMVRKPDWIQFVLEVETKHAGNFIALDNLKVEESQTKLREWDRFMPSIVPSFSAAQEALQNPLVSPLLVEANYPTDRLIIGAEELRQAELCLGSTSGLLKSERFPLEVLEVTRGLDGTTRIRFSMVRPDSGWESLPFTPGLMVCEVGTGRPRFVHRGPAIGRWALPPGDQGAPVSFEPESADPIRGDEPWVDFTVRVNANHPYPLDDFDHLKVKMLPGLGVVEKLVADFQGVGEVENEGRLIRLNYRLHRPDSGWPAEDMLVQMESDYRKLNQAPQDGTNNRMRVVPGRSAVTVSFPPRVIPKVGEVPQSVLASADSFEVRIQFRSSSAIDVETLGDDDVVLGGQSGKLEAFERLEEGKVVIATYRFRRNTRAYGTGRSRQIDFRFPAGSVADVEGAGSFGYSLASGERYLGVELEIDREAQVDSGFLALSPLSPALEAYRFRVYYRSHGAPLNVEDFEWYHLAMAPESRDASGGQDGETLWPIATVVRRLDDAGREYQVDYKVEKPTTGWPAASRIQFLNGALRDLDGGSFSNRSLSIVGIGDSVNSQVIAGSVIARDPEKHRVSLIVRVREEWKGWWFFGNGSFADAYLWLGVEGGLLPSLEEEPSASPVLAKLVEEVSPVGYASDGEDLGLLDFDDSSRRGGLRSVLTFVIERPPG
ncbi:MAG: hypothetical protein AAF514_17610, partial [Verrucomicrobiota bacterium]